jgi:hypothetical protein
MLEEDHESGGVPPHALEQLTEGKEQASKDALKQPTCMSSSGPCSPREGLVATLPENLNPGGEYCSRRALETSTPGPRRRCSD